jgi:tetratricopeptide (TPR) repeat protein
MNQYGFADQDEKENLRLDYEQTIEYVKLLTDIRFRLLVFTPVASGLTIVLSQYIFENNGIAFIIGVLGFAANFGIIIYDQRNSQIYNSSIVRAVLLEQKLKFPQLIPWRKHGGLFSERPDRGRKLLGRILAWHDRGLALVYSSSLSGWSFLIIHSILNIISNYRLVIIPQIYSNNACHSFPTTELVQINNFIYSILLATIIGGIFLYDLHRLDRGSPKGGRKYAHICYNKGNTLALEKNYQEAIKAYDEAIQLDPKFASAWYNKAVALDDLGDHQQAIKAYNKAIELDPKDGMAWYNIYLAQKASCHDRDAEAALKNAKELGYTTKK